MLGPSTPTVKTMDKLSIASISTSLGRRSGVGRLGRCIWQWISTDKNT